MHALSGRPERAAEELVFGAVTTGVVCLVVAVTKFTHGAYLVVIAAMSLVPGVDLFLG